MKYWKRYLKSLSERRRTVISDDDIKQILDWAIVGVVLGCALLTAAFTVGLAIRMVGMASGLW